MQLPGAISDLHRSKPQVVESNPDVFMVHCMPLHITWVLCCRCGDNYEKLFCMYDLCVGLILSTKDHKCVAIMQSTFLVNFMLHPSDLVCVTYWLAEPSNAATTNP